MCYYMNLFFEIQVRGKTPTILAVSSPLEIILSPVTNSNAKKLYNTSNIYYYAFLILLSRIFYCYNLNR